MNKIYKKWLAGILSLAMICNIGSLPLMASTTDESSTTIITSFTPLEANIQQQSVPVGTELEDLNLPNTLTVKGHTTDTEEETDITIEDVSWELNLESTVNQGITKYDPTMGGYAFTPILPEDYTLKNDVELPEIWVVIETRQLMSSGETFTSKTTDKEQHELIYEVIGESENTGEVKVIGMNGEASGSLTIPETVTNKGKTYSVTEIGQGAFGGHSGFTGDLIIPDSVTTIGELSFYECSGFKGTLNLGSDDSNLTTIGANAFMNSSFTGNLTLPNSVITIGQSAFNGCSSFNGTLNLGNEDSNLSTIGVGAFMNSGFTGNLTLPNSVTTIGQSAFNGCSSFNGTLNLGNEDSNLSTIGASAFSNSGFTGSLEIPNSVRTIKNDAFFGCSGFTGDLIIPDNVTTIEEQAFLNCKGLQGNLILGTENSKLETIKASAFKGCGFTGDLIIPNSVTIIERAAFDGCGFTGDLALSDNMTTIDSSFLKNCTGFTGNLILGSENSKLETIGDNTFQSMNFTGSLTIPDTVTSIGNAAFFACGKFNGTLTLGSELSNLKTIGSNAFAYSTFTGGLTIPDSVTTIGIQAFYSCGGFDKNLVIGSGVTSIQDVAFFNCQKIANIYFLGVTPPSFGENVFKSVKDEGVFYYPGSGKEAWKDIKINEKDLLEIPFNGFSIDKQSASIVSGDSITITPTINPVTSPLKPTWKSDDTSIATVNNKGQVTGNKPGKATITATLEGVTVTCDVTVTTAEGKGTFLYSVNGEFIDKNVVPGSTLNIELQLAKKVVGRSALPAKQEVNFYLGTSNSGSLIDTVTIGNDGKATIAYAIPVDTSIGELNFFAEYGETNINNVFIEEGTAMDSITVAPAVRVGMTNYANINDAIKAITASNSGKITLLRDSTYAEIIDSITKDITLELNDHDLTMTKGNLIINGANAKLTMKGSGNLVQTGINGTVVTLENGELSVESGNLEATGNNSIAVQINGGIVDISGGSFQGVEKSLYVNHANKVSLTGGTFYKGNQSSVDAGAYNVDTLLASSHVYYEGSAVSDDVLFGNVKSFDKTVTIGECSHDWSAWDEKDSGTTRTCQNKCKDTDGNITTETADAKVTVDQVTSYFTDLEEAVEAAQATSGSTLTLLADTEFKSSVGMLVDKAMILELNGKELEIDAAMRVNGEHADLSIQDGKTTGKIINPNNRCIKVSSGKLTVKSGIIEATRDSAINLVGGDVAIEGGTFKGNVALDVTDGTAILSGGSFYSQNGYPSIQVPQDKTVSNLLDVGYGLQTLDKSAWVDSSQRNIEKSVTVKKTPIAINVQPKDESVAYDDTNTPTLSVTAEAIAGDVNESIKYQWYDGDGNAISNETSNEFTFPTGKDVDTYQYYCELSRDSFVVKTNTVTVEVTRIEATISNNDYGIKYYFTDNAIVSPTKTNFTTNSDGKMSFSWATKKEPNTALVGEPTVVGAYLLTVTTAEGTNWNAGSETFDISIDYYDIKEVATLTGLIGDDGWYQGDVTISAPAGYTISSDGKNWSASLSVTKDISVDYTYYLKEDSTGYISDKKTIEIKRDATAPTNLTLVSSDVTDSSVTLIASATDATSGIKKYTLTEANDPNLTQSNDNGVFNLTGLSPNTIYNFSVTVKDKAGNEAKIEKQITTNKASLENAEVTLSNHIGLTYTGLAQKPSVSVKLNGVILDADQYTINYGDNINTGTCIVTITASENGDYSGDVTQETSFEIEKAIPRVLFEKTTQTSSYTGSPVKLEQLPHVTLVNGESFTGEISYTYTEVSLFSMFGLGEKAKVGLPTNVGTYTITAHIQEAGNYEGADSANTLIVTIEKSDPSLTIDHMKGKIYDGNAIEAPTKDDMTIKGAAYEDVTFRYSTEQTMNDATDKAPCNAGTYWVQAIVLNSKNTNSAQSKPMSFTISPKVVTDPSISLEYDEIEFDGLEKEPAVISVKDGDVVIPSSEYSVTYSDNINVSNKATVTINDVTGGNYVVTGRKTFEILKKKQAPLLIEEISTKTYGDDAFTLHTTGGSGDGSISYQSSDPSIISIEGNKAIIHQAGTVILTAHKDADGSYHEIDATYSITIQKKTITFTADDLTVGKGQTMPTLSYQVNGMVNGDQIVKEPMISTTIMNTNTVGTYPINISGGEVSNGTNYDMEYVAGKLIVQDGTGDIDTGDQTNPMLWIMLLGICFSSLIVLKRSKKHNKRS